MRAPTGAHQVITETNALNTVEGSRLPWQGCTRCINTSMATMSDHSKVSGDRTTPPIQHPPFIQNGHVAHGMCMAGDVTSDMMLCHKK